MAPRCVCTGVCVTRPRQDKRWPQCKEQSRDKQARGGRRQRHGVSVGQLTHTSALSQQKIVDLGCYMQGFFLKRHFQLSSLMGIFYIMCVIHYIIKKKVTKEVTGPLV